jgi:hypothetical protein
MTALGQRDREDLGISRSLRSDLGARGGEDMLDRYHGGAKKETPGRDQASPR